MTLLHRVGFAVAASFVALGLGVARADAPKGRYLLEGGVHDTKTGLWWQQPASSTTYAWAEAKAYCKTQGTSARLPTLKELQSLVDVSKTIATAPFIDQTAFPDTMSYRYWTSTPVAADPSMAWYVSFSGGGSGQARATVAYFVRCVY